MREPGMYRFQELDYWLLKIVQWPALLNPSFECEGSIYSFCRRWSSSRMRWIYKKEVGADNGKPPLQSALPNMIDHRSFSFPAKAYVFFIKTKEIISNININIKY